MGNIIVQGLRSPHLITQGYGKNLPHIARTGLVLDARQLVIDLDASQLTLVIDARRDVVDEE